jgi:hypothetical protein
MEIGSNGYIMEIGGAKWLKVRAVSQNKSQAPYGICRYEIVSALLDLE